MRAVARKKKQVPQVDKNKAVHDIIKVLEVNHAKAEVKLTEIKMLCCPKIK